jgi:hypothetical protein
MTHPKVPKDLSLAPVAVSIDTNLERFRELDGEALRGKLELELDRPTGGASREERRKQILRAAVRNVDLHGWDAAITPDGARLRLHGGSVTLDIGLSAAIMRYIEGES